MASTDWRASQLFLLNIVLFILLSMSVGCSILPRNPVPLDQMPYAEIAGIPGVHALVENIWGQK